MQEALSFRQRLLSSDGCSFTADVTADQGDSTYSFQLQCTYRDGKGELTVTQPETIAGISAACTNGSDELIFDGTVLALGDLKDGSIAPLSAPWLFGSAWESDEITSASSEEDGSRMTIQKGYDEEKIFIDTWLLDGVPVAGEASDADGRRELSVLFHDFHFLEKTP